MRVTSVDLYSASLVEPVRFSLHDTDPTARYQIRQILGLDAEEIIPKFYGKALISPTKFYNFSMKPRDIVMRAVLSPRFHIDESYSDIRDELYRTISSNRSGIVDLYFKSGESIISTIKGSITKFEVPYFVKLPEIQVTIHCNDPIFRGLNPVIFTPTELDSSGTYQVFIPDSLSTAPHGFSMAVVFTAPSPYFRIQDLNINPDWTFEIIPNEGFLTGDVLYISTEFSDKKIYMTRGGVTTQLVDKLAPGSIWPVIFHGQNEFAFVDIDKIDWHSFQYYPAYWGV